MNQNLLPDGWVATIHISPSASQLIQKASVALAFERLQIVQSIWHATYQQLETRLHNHISEFESTYQRTLLISDFSNLEFNEISVPGSFGILVTVDNYEVTMLIISETEYNTVNKAVMSRKHESINLGWCRIELQSCKIELKHDD